MRVREAQSALQEGNAFNASGQVDAAIAAYRRAIGHHPVFGAAHYNLGIALRRARDWRGAALAFRQAARLDPRDYDAVQKAADTAVAARRAIEQRVDDGRELAARGRLRRVGRRYRQVVIEGVVAGRRRQATFTKRLFSTRQQFGEARLDDGRHVGRRFEQRRFSARRGNRDDALRRRTSVGGDHGRLHLPAFSGGET